MSQATFRHLNALSMKYELLREIKHWKHSCKACLDDVTNNIRSLRESRAEVKREINATRAKLEERLKELEEVSEKHVFEMVAKEEEALKKFAKKLSDRQKRLESTENILQGNVIGFKLKRSLEDGKYQALALRETMLEFRKYNMASGVVFKLKEQLYAIIESLDSLGTIALVRRSSQTNNDSNKGQTKTNGISRKEAEVEVSVSSSGSYQDTLSNGDARSKSIDNTLINDLEFVLGMESKYEHSLKPFLNNVKELSMKYNKFRTESIDSTKVQPSPKVMEYAQTPKLKHRTQSATDGGQGKPKIHTRLSKSAREDGRNVGSLNMCLNDVDISYVPFEEQGPESKEVKKKRTLSVRYHDFDFVKEITAIKDDSIDKEDAQEPLTHAVIFPNGMVKDIGRVQSPGSQSNASTTISSVSYKPSSALASGPVHIPASELRKSDSYFTYTARFHTKKHPNETDLCRLTGIIALDNGQIVIADINHLQIMLFGPDYTYLDALECPSPCGVCKVSEKAVAVTLFHNRKLLQVKVSTIHLIRDKEIHVPCQESLSAVCYNNNKYYVLCFAGDIHILDDDGRQLNILETGINAGEARHMVMDGDANMIFASGHNRISCFKESGEKLWQYSCITQHKRFTPADMVLYHDRLFVADWTGHKVLELSMDGSRVRDVVIDNVEYPYALAVQTSSRRLFITQSNFFRQEARSRSVKVFDIK